MAAKELREALRAAGLDAVVNDANPEFVTFPYEVEVGDLVGARLTIGLQGPDWPINPPGGVHVSPRIQHPGDEAHHVSPLGAAWIYWSRPFPDWSNSQRSIDDYLAHLRNLFAQFATTTAA